MSARKPSLLLLAALIAGSGCSTPTLVQRPALTASRYLIHDVRVFTGEADAPVLAGADVLIEDGLIAKVSEERLPTSDATIIDGRGKTLLPGLIDAHTHITASTFVPWAPTLLPTQEFNRQAALYAGITCVWDMGGQTASEMTDLAREIDSGELLGPHLFHAGMGFTSVGGHPIPFLDLVQSKIFPLLWPFIPKVAIEVGSIEDLAELDRHLESGAHFTKVYLDAIPTNAPLMDETLLREIVKRSHAHGKPVLFHAGSNANVQTVIDVGGDGLAHTVYKEPIDPALAAQLADKGIFVVPTMVVWINYDLVANQHRLDHFTRLELETTHSSRLDAYAEPTWEPASGSWREYDRVLGENIQFLRSNVRTLREAGVTILAGSDTPNFVISVGGSLHTELQHLVEAGSTPAEALAAATSVPADVLARLTGQRIDFGRVQEGLRADLLLVRGDPTQDIAATREIEEVFLGGVRLQRHAPVVARGGD